jgi:hypothetical protein
VQEKSSQNTDRYYANSTPGQIRKNRPEIKEVFFAAVKNTQKTEALFNVLDQAENRPFSRVPRIAHPRAWIKA